MDDQCESMRKRADWMTRADDEILEVLRDLRASSPTELETIMAYSKQHINRRLHTLHNYRLLERPSRGLYRINESAEEYLDEQLDASELEPREEPDEE